MPIVIPPNEFFLIIGLIYLTIIVLLIISSLRKGKYLFIVSVMLFGCIFYYRHTTQYPEEWDSNTMAAMIYISCTVVLSAIITHCVAFYMWVRAFWVGGEYVRELEKHDNEDRDE